MRRDVADEGVEGVGTRHERGTQFVSPQPQSSISPLCVRINGQTYQWSLVW